MFDINEPERARQRRIAAEAGRNDAAGGRRDEFIGGHTIDEDTMTTFHDRLLRTLPLAALAGTAMSLTLLAAAPAHAAPPTISCIGGISTGTACICRQPSVQVQTGPSSYRCVMGDLTSVPSAGPFGLRDQAHSHPQVMVGPAGHGFGRPALQPMGRQSSLPVGRPMMAR